MAVYPSSTLHSCQYDTKCLTFEYIVQAALVAEIVSLFNLNPLVPLVQTSQGELCVRADPCENESGPNRNSPPAVLSPQPRTGACTFPPPCLSLGRNDPSFQHNDRALPSIAQIFIAVAKKPISFKISGEETDAPPGKVPSRANSVSRNP